MPCSSDGQPPLPLVVFLPEEGDGYVLRYDVTQRPRVARDGRVYARRTVQPFAPTTPAWFLYSERPVDAPRMTRALTLLKDFVASEKKVQ